MVHINNGILLSYKRNKFESVELRWMKLEPVTQSKVSQKEKNKYHILIHIYGMYKNGTDEPVYKTGIDRHRERTCGCRAGRRGWGELRLRH